MNDVAFRRHARHLLLAWIALLALMGASLAGSYLPLGAGNLVLGLAIAALKAGIVLVLFMGLARAGVAVRLAAGVAVATLALLLGLSSVDFATRAQAPAAYQGSAR
ncbi:cytochrome C oxidase subunit IV family protein [Ramlibacter alkalitolerans]|uniref:Caa(3)-type oxidase subunit IV n=1 Tax=Ramlibacter alkalitolerans TaxID=2039631 RepID=A0ABS1JIE2_9BURK|nr:Caa(3)-type oxidase subunit IV [Ramlibacter alkalitolerans]MBL0423979.1 Caa(3)-type oxidase subunit IV [Ramlibacter alkalitolerans]